MIIRYKDEEGVWRFPHECKEIEVTSTEDLYCVKIDGKFVLREVKNEFIRDK